MQMIAQHLVSNANNHAHNS